MPEAKLKVELLRFTESPDLAAATAAHMCYAGVSVEELKKRITPEKAEKLLASVIESGHWSVLEHANFTFGIEGVSRALTHQLVRHRLASYAQQSQRYVDEKNFAFVVPPKIKADAPSLKKFGAHMEASRKLYAELSAIAPKEDARYVLPNAVETRIVVTMNARALFNFFERRLCTRAQWEIRALASEMLKEAKKAAPLIFKTMGPVCDRLGYCPEKESCWEHCKRRPLKKDVVKSQ